MDEKNPLAWIFECPFCGVRCLRRDHHEVYAWAYKHLQGCPQLGDTHSTSGRHEPVDNYPPLPF